MNRNQRPLSVTILGCLYLVVGIAGFVFHLPGMRAGNAFQPDIIWPELIEIVAIICGAFLLRGHNWARWLAVAWIAFHVILSAFHALQEFAVHLVFCVLITWFLFRPAAGRYFRGAQTEPS
jgi:hypothetical protein